MKNIGEREEKARLRATRSRPITVGISNTSPGSSFKPKSDRATSPGRERRAGRARET